MISVKKSTESNGKHAFVVECRLLPLLDGKQQQHEDVTRTKKFMCKGWDDRDAQSKVLRFVMATDVVSAFREFLFNEPDGCAMARREGSLAAGATIARPDGVMPLGSSLGKIGFEETAKRKIRSFVCVRRKQACGLKYAVALCRTENGCLRSISFHEQASSVDKDGAVRSAEDQAVDRAVLFLRSVAFESWRKQGVGVEALQREREQAGAMIGSKHARERGLKHPCSFVEMEQGEKVDCSCGKNRSRGLMLACERCGAWEHAECKGYRNDKQVIVPLHVLTPSSFIEQWGTNSSFLFVAFIRYPAYGFSCSKLCRLSHQDFGSDDSLEIVASFLPPVLLGATQSS